MSNRKGKDKGEEGDAEKPAPVKQPTTPGVPTQTAEQAAEEAKETVTMVFPREVLLTVDNSRRIRFPQGTRQVPADLADHPWLKANGVKRYKK